MFAESHLFKTAIGYIFHILIYVIGVQSENPSREKILIVGYFEINALYNNISYFCGKIRRQQLAVFFKNIVNEINAELKMQAFVPEHPIDHRTKIAKLVTLTE